MAINKSSAVEQPEGVGIIRLDRSLRYFYYRLVVTAILFHYRAIYSPLVARRANIVLPGSRIILINGQANSITTAAIISRSSIIESGSTTYFHAIGASVLIKVSPQRRRDDLTTGAKFEFNGGSDDRNWDVGRESLPFDTYVLICGRMSEVDWLHRSTSVRRSFRIFSRSSGQSLAWPTCTSKSLKSATWVLISIISCGKG